MREGNITRVFGFLVVAREIPKPMMGEVVLVGEKGLVGEINRIVGDQAFIQVYEDTTGLRTGDTVTAIGRLLSAELGPGMLGEIYDGLQRPLEDIAQEAGAFIRTGLKAKRLDHEKKWHFVPSEDLPKKVSGGEILGKVKENEVIEHRILVPPNVAGDVKSLAEEGDYTIVEPILRVSSVNQAVDVKMAQEWPVKAPRPFAEKLDPNEPLITGVRVIDFLFPISKGGSAGIPGPFGSGKTVTLQQISKQADADIIIYVGCGERGNEMADLLDKYKALSDPRTKIPLLRRSIVIANTSNMPVAARESSIFLGATMAEYFRDMGYNVAMIADSTSRWAEALRELGSRMEEIPGEEGFPAYLASRLQGFYSRAGRVRTLGGRIGSVSLMGAVSPPGGDFSEPVTQKTLQSVKVFWGLDAELAHSRHFPAINWTQSYSLYVDNVAVWWELNVSERWRQLRSEMLRLLKEEDELMQLVRLVGSGALDERERATLEIAKVIRTAFLQQSALTEEEAYSDLKKTFAIAEVIDYYKEQVFDAISNGVLLEKIQSMGLSKEIESLKTMPLDECLDKSVILKERIVLDISELPKLVKAKA